MFRWLAESKTPAEVEVSRSRPALLSLAAGGAPVLVKL
mgnify:FL=1